VGNKRAFSPHVKWSHYEVAVLRDKYAESSWVEIESLLPARSRSQIQNKANGLGLTRKKPPARTPEEVRQAKREHMAARRAANPQKVREYQMRQYHSQRDRYCERMRNYARRRFFWNRANKLRGPDAATYKDLACIWKNQRGLCALTGVVMTRAAHVDHIVPKARGGGDQASNLQWVCNEVNMAKRDMTNAEFLFMCENVMRWIGQRIAAVDALESTHAA